MAGVAQESVLAPLLYTLFTADLLSSNHTNIATFANNTVIMSNDCDHIKASQKLQTHMASIESWLKKWKIEANTSKSTKLHLSVILNNAELSQSDSAKYIGIHLDRKLTRQKHIWYNGNHLV